MNAYAMDGLYLICPDLHFPFHDPRFTAICLDVLRYIRPSGFVQLGDFVDWWQLSTYDQDPSRKETILEDLNLYSAFLEEVDRDLVAGVIHQLEGNHCDRLRRYTWRNAKGLACIIPAIPTLLRFEERNDRSKNRFVWHAYHNYLSCRLGDTVIHHGHYFDQSVAVNNLKRYRGYNFIQGHTHRVQFATNDSHFSASLGHGSLPAKTAHTPAPNDWGQALGILSVFKGKGSLEIATVNDGEARLWGRIFKG